MPKAVTAFSKKTFDYLEASRKNKKNRDWFEKHRDQYREVVHEPFSELIRLLDKNFTSELPKIEFVPRKIARPILRSPDDDGGILRTNATAFFSEKPTSQFEWNPGIYVSIGSKPEDCVLGLGLYMISSRQMSRLRQGIVEDFDHIDSLLTSRKLVKSWGPLSGEVYKRFLKGYEGSRFFDPLELSLVLRQVC